MRLDRCILIMLFSLITVSATAQQPFFRLQIGHPESVVSMDFSPDGKSILSCSYDSAIKLWDARTGGDDAGV
jgi:WD40 repeat protein